MNSFFFELTPDRVLDAIESSGFEPTGHCMVLNSYENRVYDFMLEGGSHIIGKFYRPGRWSAEQIQAEHDFLYELDAEEITVCKPLLFSDKKTIHEVNDIFYAVWPRTGGRVPDELSDDDLLMLGRLIARIHNVGASKKAGSRLTLSGESYGINPLRFLTENNFIPQHCVKRYSDAVHEIAEIYGNLSKGVPFHRIHGDCHLGNILRGREGFFFLDFDDFLNGPAVQDIWMVTPSRDTEGLRQRSVLLDGYRQFRDFDSSWLRLVEPLRSLRYIHYSAWIAKRWSDPVFPHAFPHFGTESYWEEETANLEDQLDYIYNKSDIPESMKRADQPEEELTNKDFFWDMD